MKSRNIGLYVGAFDPIHEGHLDFAKNAIEQNHLDKLYFLVEPRPKYRQGVKAHSHRVNMVILGVADNDLFGTLVIKSKTAIEEYLPILQNRFRDANLFLIIPEEDVFKFIKWTSLISIDHKKLYIAVGLRKDSQNDVSGKLDLLSQTSGIKFNHHVFLTQTEPNKTTEIKRKLRKGEKPQGIPSTVYDYIHQQSLYAASD